MAVALARIRMPLIYLGLVLVLINSFIHDLPRWPVLGVTVAAFAISLRLGTVRRPPVEVAAPVVGRWLAYNSPANRVPSAAGPAPQPLTPAGPAPHRLPIPPDHTATTPPKGRVPV